MVSRELGLSFARAVHAGAFFGLVVSAWDVLFGEAGWPWTQAAVRGTVFAIAMLATDC